MTPKKATYYKAFRNNLYRNKMMKALNAVIGSTWTRYRGCLIEKKGGIFLVLRFHESPSLEDAKIYIDQSIQSFGKNFKYDTSSNNS